MPPRVPPAPAAAFPRIRLHLLLLRVLGLRGDSHRGPRSSASWNLPTALALFLASQTDACLQVLISNFILNNLNLASAHPPLLTAGPGDLAGGGQRWLPNRQAQWWLRPLP